MERYGWIPLVAVFLLAVAAGLLNGHYFRLDLGAVPLDTTSPLGALEWLTVALVFSTLMLVYFTRGLMTEARRARHLQ